MADITDPIAVNFANQQIRTLCDKIPGLYALILNHSVLFAQTPGLSALFPNEPTAVIQDGSGQDGRRQITGADVVAFEAFIASVVAGFQAGNSAVNSLILKIAVNPSALS